MTTPGFLPSTPLAPRLSGQLAVSSRRHVFPRQFHAARMSLDLSPQALVSRARSDTSLLLNVSAKVFSAVALATLLSLPTPTDAAPSGGRVGGSSFRSRPTPRATAPRAPSGGYSGGYYGGYGYGGYAPSSLFFSPFLFPMVPMGGGLGGLLFFAGAAALASSALRGRTEEEEGEETVGVVTLKVGLLSSATGVREKLERVTREANTNTEEGLAYVLSESVLALLRASDYWVYGSVDVGQGKGGERLFEEACMRERRKLSGEGVVNVGGRRSEELIAGNEDGVGEYLAVWIVAAAEGSVISRVAKRIDGSADVERTLNGLSGVGRTAVRGVEVVWAPAMKGEVYSERELLEDHPELTRL